MPPRFAAFFCARAHNRPRIADTENVSSERRTDIAIAVRTCKKGTGQSGNAERTCQKCTGIRKEQKRGARKQMRKAKFGFVAFIYSHACKAAVSEKQGSERDMQKTEAPHIRQAGQKKGETQGAICAFLFFYFSDFLARNARRAAFFLVFLRRRVSERAVFWAFCVSIAFSAPFYPPKKPLPFCAACVKILGKGGLSWQDQRHPKPRTPPARR